ncbi:MAG: flavodoxin [Marinilabiliales bacterium]|nr:MAG: flavodoxin [Marinilabiliales bacterium]
MSFRDYICVKAKLMKTAILYASTHGTSEKAAQLLSDKIGNCDLINLRKIKKVDLNDYSKLIIGGSIHMGKMQQRVRSFIEKYQAEIIDKKFALFMCCMDEKQEENQLKSAFPADLQAKAVMVTGIGGEFLFDKMNFLERAMVKKISGSNESVHRLYMDKIEALADAMKQ